jgi:hypothetical protein
MRGDAGSIRGAGAILLIALTACENVDGGAVELSWALRPASAAIEDKFVNCNSDEDGTGPITAIRLDWTVDIVVDGMLEQHVDAEEWPCNDSHGVTGFVLPEGSALFGVTPVCEFGPADPSSYIAPAVEQRRVIVGDTVNLGAVELVVQVSDCTRQRCICQ